jgi:hypothetical protein
VLKLLALVGIGVAVRSRLQNRNLSPASMYEAPSPTPAPPKAAGPVPPGAVGEPAPQPDDLARLEDEAPLADPLVAETIGNVDDNEIKAPDAPPEDSLNTLFDEVLNETATKGSRRR